MEAEQSASESQEPDPEAEPDFIPTTNISYFFNRRRSEVYSLKKRLNSCHVSSQDSSV